MCPEGVNEDPAGPQRPWRDFDLHFEWEGKPLTSVSKGKTWCDLLWAEQEGSYRTVLARIRCLTSPEVFIHFIEVLYEIFKLGLLLSHFTEEETEALGSNSLARAQPLAGGGARLLPEPGLSIPVDWRSTDPHPSLGPDTY